MMIDKYTNTHTKTNIFTMCIFNVSVCMLGWRVGHPDNCALSFACREGKQLFEK